MTFSVRVNCGNDSVIDDSADCYLLTVLWIASRFAVMVPVEQSQTQRYVSLSLPDGSKV